MKRFGFSLKPAAIGDLLLRHGEKLAFMTVVTLAALMVLSGINAVRSHSVGPDRTPKAVTDLARQASANIEAARRIPADRLPNRQPVAPLIDPWRPQQVKIAKAPENRSLLSRPLFAELTKRTKPAVLPIEDLRAVAGVAVLPNPKAESIDQVPIAPPPRDAELPPEADPGRRPPRGKPPRSRGREGQAGLFGPDVTMPPELSPPSASPQQPGVITPFVTVTGLIPAGRQQAEYDRRFGSASFRDPRRDKPRWGVYVVERARIGAGGPGRWERLEVKNVERDEQVGRVGVAPTPPGGAGEAKAMLMEQEVLPQAFFLQPEEREVGYAAAVPERIDGPWGTALVHPWFIPRLEEFLEKPDEQEEEPAPVVGIDDLLEEPKAKLGNFFRLEGVVLDESPERQRDVGLYKFGVRKGARGGATEIGTIGSTRDVVFALSERWGRQLTVEGTTADARSCNVRVRMDPVGKTPVARILSIELLDDAGEVVDTLTEPDPAPVVAADAAGGEAMPGPDGGGKGILLAENRLFRFVDTNVKAGETYRYRVKFALRNPNVRLSPKHLVDPSVAKEEFLVSDYSNETPDVRVPEATALVVRTSDRDTAKKMRIKGDDLEVMVLAPSEKTGNFTLRSALIGVGGVANVEKSKGADVRFFGDEVTTDRILVDARGPQDHRSGTRGIEPAAPLEMLFLRDDGSFEFVTPADSERQVRRYGSTLFRPGTEVPDDGRPDRGPRTDRGTEPLPRGPQ